MLWFKGQYVRYLEKEISRVQQENKTLRGYADQLVERLLRKSGIPSIELPAEPTKEALAKMLQSGAGGIFDDLEEPKVDEQEDNRKDRFDEFVS